jgi:hypothetical protein
MLTRSIAEHCKQKALTPDVRALRQHGFDDPGDADRDGDDTDNALQAAIDRGEPARGDGKRALGTSSNRVCIEAHERRSAGSLYGAAEVFRLRSNVSGRIFRECVASRTTGSGPLQPSLIFERPIPPFAGLAQR